MTTSDVKITIACNHDMAVPVGLPHAPVFAIEGKPSGDVEFRVNGAEMFTLDNTEWCRFLRELNRQVMK